jgi:hypothetical protein
VKTGAAISGAAAFRATESRAVVKRAAMCCTNETECGEELCWVELNSLLRVFIVRVSVDIGTVRGDTAVIYGLNM